MNQPFSQKRRQVFLTEAYSTEYARWLRESTLLWQQSLPEGDCEQEKEASAASLVANNMYQLFSLRYTAGELVEQLRDELTGVVEAYERYQAKLSELENEKDTAVLYFREIAHYQRLMQLIGLAYLLHRRDLLPRIAHLVDTNFKGADALVEEFLDYGLDDRVDTDQMFHPEPYVHLLHAMFKESDDDSVDEINKYVTSWYPAMNLAPWHDSHQRIRGTEGDYFGYWAFEAGAVAYLLDLDDTSITHMIYPRDLVKWARENKHLAEPVATPNELLRCEGGQPCPRTGWWFTPAKVGSRRLFQAGEVMPTFTSDYGATIWQWDAKQE